MHIEDVQWGLGCACICPSLVSFVLVSCWQHVIFG